MNFEEKVKRFDEIYTKLIKDLSEISNNDFIVAIALKEFSISGFDIKTADTHVNFEHELYDLKKELYYKRHTEDEINEKEDSKELFEFNE